MASWIQNFNEHALWAKVAALQTKVSELERPEDGNDQDSVEYISAALETIAGRQDSTPAILVTSPMLQRVADQVDNLSSTIDQWVAGTYSWQNLDSATQGLLDSLGTWPPLTADATSRAFVSGAKRIHEHTDEVIDAVDDKRNALIAAVDGLESRVTTIGSTVEESQAQLENALETFDDASTSAIEEARAAWTSAQEAEKQSADGHLDTLSDLERQARDLVHAATSSVVATDYGKYARNKALAAWACDLGAATLGSTGIGAILYHLYQEGITADGNIGLSLTRLAASIGTLGIAALVAKRGTEHHHESVAAKRTDLALRQVGPFVANLPEDVREQVAMDLTDRVFIRGELGAGEVAEGADSLRRRVESLRARRSGEA